MTPNYQQMRKIRQSCCHRFYPQPFLIAFFNYSHKRLTFAFAGKSGYTICFAQRIRTQRLTQRSKGLHSCHRVERLTPHSHLDGEKPEKADTRLWRVSAFSGVAAPLGCVIFFASVEIAVCTSCAGLSACARWGWYRYTLRVLSERSTLACQSCLFAIF